MSNLTGEIAPFNPGTLPPEKLESLFVGRKKEASDLVKRIKTCASEKTSIPQLLIIAPRGYGKTHLLHIVYNRLKKSTALKKNLAIALFKEEEHVHNYLDFLRRILKALKHEYKASELDEALGNIYENPSKIIISDTEKFLIKFIGKRVLLIMLENFGDILHGLGTEGQKRLRAFIQESRNISILGTAQRLFEPKKVRTFPFYGFFERIYLEPFDTAQTLKLLKQISDSAKNTELSKFLGTSIGEARVSAVKDLTGGNPRLITLLSEFLDKEKLDELTKAFTNFVEISLTPYYQEQLNRLAPLQKRIVELLCEKADGRPLPVNEIATKALTSSQSISSQLKKMQEQGVLNSQKLGRETLYEMMEPLWRVSIEVKNSREGILPIFVQFLKMIKKPKELFTELLGTDSNLKSLHKHCSLALKESLESMGKKEKDQFLKEPFQGICNSLPNDVENAISLLKPLVASGLPLAKYLLHVLQVLDGKKAPKTLGSILQNKPDAIPELIQGLTKFVITMDIQKEKNSFLNLLKFILCLEICGKNDIRPLKNIDSNNPSVLSITISIMAISSNAKTASNWLLEIAKKPKKRETIIGTIAFLTFHPRNKRNYCFPIAIQFMENVSENLLSELINRYFDKLCYLASQSNQLEKYLSVLGERLSERELLLYTLFMGHVLVDKDEDFLSFWEKNRETVLKAISKWKTTNSYHDILLKAEAYSKGDNEAIADFPLELRKQFEKAKAERGKKPKGNRQNSALPAS